MSDVQNRKNRNKTVFIAAFAATMAAFAAIRHFTAIEIPAKLGEAQKTTCKTVFSESETYNGETSHNNDIYGRPHPINGVWSFDKCFPDKNDVQITAAEANGITPVAGEKDVIALVASHKLVNISNSPFYRLDNLTHSLPYLVPKAQNLLNTISLNFIDSLQMKGIEPHLLVITSALRTTDSVRELQQGNGNATTNSCHCYGTTVDISYNRFIPITGRHVPSADITRRDDDIKQVLSEVLSDLRNQEKCYVKYEIKQGCFHLTVR